MRRARTLAAVVAVFALALTAAGEAAAPRTGIFIPGESLGGVRVGMTKAEVKEAWGERYGVCRDCRRTTWYFNFRSFAPEGAGVLFEDGRVAHVFTVWRPRGWQTDAGLALGAASFEIGDAYPGLGERSCTGYSALVSTGEGIQSVFYVYREKLWGFGLTKPGASPCL